MALLYFDGFETYGVIPTSSSATGVHTTAPLTGAGWTGTSTGLGASFNIARPATTLDASSRSWLSTLYTTKPSVATNVPWNTHLRSFGATGNVLTVGFKAAIQYANVAAGWQALCRIGYGQHSFDVVVGTPAIPATTNNIAVFRLTNPTSATFATISNGTQATPNLGASTWAFTQQNTVEASIDKTTGLVSVWINNTFVGSTTLTPNTNDVGCQVEFGEWATTSNASSVPSPIYITDFYVVDSAGAAPTSRLGKVKVVTRVPTADAQAQFVKPSGAASNAAVAGQIPPSATNYLTGIAHGDTDLYSSSAFSFSNETIIATAVVTSGYKTDAGGNNLQAALDLNGTVYTGAEIVLPVSATYSTTQSIFTTNPATGLKFTKAELDAAAFGMRVKDPAA